MGKKLSPVETLLHNFRKTHGIRIKNTAEIRNLIYHLQHTSYNEGYEECKKEYETKQAIENKKKKEQEILDLY